MLIALPAWFASGFCLGYLLGRWGSALLALWHKPASQEPPQFEALPRDELGRFVARDRANPNIAAPDDSWIWVVLGLVAVVTLAIFASGWPMAGGHLLWIAAMAVGAMGGQWFATNGTRDQLAFITGAGAFLFLGALEYDHQLFAKLTKFGGSQFSVEFSNDGGRNKLSNAQNPVPTLGSPADNYLNVVFPGSSGVDLSLGFLMELPNSIVSDEQYANLFTNINLNNSSTTIDLSPTTIIPHMQPGIQRSLVFACDKIIPFVEDLFTLQQFYRNETSPIALPPNIVSAIKRIYVRNRDWATKENYFRNSAKSGDNASSQKIDTQGDIEAKKKKAEEEQKEDFDEEKSILSGTFFGDQLGDLKRELRGLHIDESDVINKDVYQINYSPSDKLVYTCDIIETVLKQYKSSVSSLGDILPRKDEIPSEEGEQDDQYLSYFALIVSAAEFSGGSRESAIHLLEREIKYLQRKLPRSAPITGGVTNCAADLQPEETIKCGAKREKDRQTRLPYRAGLSH
jgi:hypothetical protein